MKRTHSHPASLLRPRPWRSRTSIYLHSFSTYNSFTFFLTSLVLWMCVCCGGDNHRLLAQAVTEAEIFAKEVAWARRVAAKHQQRTRSTTTDIHPAAHPVTAANMDAPYPDREKLTAVSLLPSVGVPEDIEEAPPQESPLSLLKSLSRQQGQEQQQQRRHVAEDKHLRQRIHSPAESARSTVV